MAGTSGRKIIRPRVMEFLVKAPGTQHFIADLAAGFDVSEKQMQECIAGIVREEQLPGLEVKIPGRSWIYRPSQSKPKAEPSARRVFEELATAKGGDLIIQDQDGNLYRARELE